MRARRRLRISFSGTKDLPAAGAAWDVFGFEVMRLASEGGWYVPMGLMSRAPVAFLLIAFLIWGIRSWKRDQIEGRAEG